MLDVALQCADDCHLTADALVLALLACTIFANPLWRLICFYVAYYMVVPFAVEFKDGVCPPAWYVWPAFFIACFYTPVLSLLNAVHRKQPVKGAVFVTGCDSGMGYHTACELAAAGFDVFAGLFTFEKSKSALEAQVKSSGGAQALGRLTCVPLDVTSDDSVAAAADTVQRSGVTLARLALLP